MAGRADPHAVLGVGPGADQAEIHTAYRAAVRRTHPDAGGTAAAFEAVQEAYETLRDTPRRAGSTGGGRPRQPQQAAEDGRPRQRPDGSDDAAGAERRMEAILAESRRLEDEARRLAGLPPRHGPAGSQAPESTDSVTAILRDAGDQLREAARPIGRELRKRLRRYL